MSKRLYLGRVGAIVALSLLVAGCGGGGGGGGKTLKIVSDLPLQGSDRVQTTQMNRAIKFILDQNNNKAGKYDIDFEENDDATAAKGAWDEAKCTENARNYVDDEDVVVNIGTYNSGCAALEIPILGRANLLMISPANTYAGLTHKAPSVSPDEPDKYFPTGKRNYMRVVASDDNQGRVGADFMKNTLHVTKVYILDDKELYGKGVADDFEGAARSIGLTVAGHTGWDKDAPNYRALMTKIKRSGADGIYIGGISTLNGGQLVKDKFTVVGDNNKVKLLVSDGFVLTSLFDEAGKDKVEGAYGTAPTLPVDKVTGAGKKFLTDFKKAEGGKDIEVYTLYAAAAAQVAVDAISRSDGTRQGVLNAAFQTNIPDSVVGPLSFDANGDPKEKVETVYQGKNGHWTFLKRVKVSGA